jgi:phosphatidylethanolamine/phosphatidyl-N-methylethanolamine N-methyltransferase
MRMTNRWNRLIYKFWSPVYDLLFDRLLFAAGRKRAFELLRLQKEERVLLVGAGTGADLPYLSADMLLRASNKLPEMGTISLIRGDVQNLPVRQASFDVAVLSLILSVVPDGQVCWRETIRAVRPGGRVIIYDKFLPDDRSSNLPRAILNLGAKLLGTDINRHLGEILAGTVYSIIHNEASLFNGMYRIVLIQTTERQI